MNPQKIQALIKAAYLEAADWADDVRLDHAFLDDAEAVVTAFYEAFREEITWRDLAEQAGHDLWLTLVLVAACTAPGPDDYEAALEQQRLYNEMVCEGSWPPYDGPVNCDER
jgi:hypothetical protein